MQGFVLYNAPQSTCSQRVRYVLHVKNLAFEEHRLDLFAGDQLKPEYLTINPNGVVPSLVHAGQAVTDSAVIMEYLEDIHPSSLRPSDAFGAAKMRAMMRFIDEVPTPAIRVPSYNLAFLPHYQTMTAKEFQDLCDAKPLRREFLMKMGRTGFPDQDMNEALNRLRRGIQRMASWLSDNEGPWLMGGQMTLADIAIMPVIVRMDDIGLASQWSDSPAIQSWLDAIRRTDAFTKAYYHGSLLTEKYPHLQTERKGLPIVGSDV
mgnify:CR=1 FL=1